MDSWMFAASDWNRADPPFSHAVLRLFDCITDKKNTQGAGSSMGVDRFTLY